MTKIEAMRYLEGVNGKQIKLGLGPMTALMEALDWPDSGLKIIHVTGTNGKGSVSQMMSQILQCSGYKVGIYNTPYFDQPNECVCINGEMILDKDLLDYMNQVEPILKDLEEKEMLPSGFEILTAVALLYFRDRLVDFVILEVGLGGRLDATNVIRKSYLSIITKIAMDHKNFLGDTLAAIAGEKAGIIKEKGLVVTPMQDEEVMQVFRSQCHKQEAQLMTMQPQDIEVVEVREDSIHFSYKHEQYSLGISGKYQAYNASLVIKAVEVLNEQYGLEIHKKVVEEGLSSIKWPGRFEKVMNKPICFIDGAHNVDGMVALAETLEALPKRKTIAIIGILKDKEVDEMLKIIASHIDVFIVTKPLNPRAMACNILAQKIKEYTEEVYIEEEIDEALKLALAMANLAMAKQQEDTQILGCGSLYMLGRLRKIIVSSLG